MPVKVARRGNKFRVVESATGKIVTNKAGTPVDGAGHSSRDKAKSQVQAINTSLKKRKKI